MNMSPEIWTKAHVPTDLEKDATLIIHGRSPHKWAFFYATKEFEEKCKYDTSMEITNICCRH